MNLTNFSPPPPIKPMSSDQAKQLIYTTQINAAAALASGIIAASERAHSIDDAKKLMHDIFYSLFGEPNTPNYHAWQNATDTSVPYK